MLVSAVVTVSRAVRRLVWMVAMSETRLVSSEATEAASARLLARSWRMAVEVASRVPVLVARFDSRCRAHPRLDNDSRARDPGRRLSITIQVPD